MFWCLYYSVSQLMNVTGQLPSNGQSNVTLATGHPQKPVANALLLFDEQTVISICLWYSACHMTKTPMSTKCLSNNGPQQSSLVYQLGAHVC